MNAYLDKDEDTPTGDKTDSAAKLWMNKLSGQLMISATWWEMQNDETIVRGNAGNIFTSTEKTENARKWKYGMLTQVGFLLQNESGVWFGVGMSAREQFEEIGDID